jgi:hypothetical protein
MFATSKIAILFVYYIGYGGLATFTYGSMAECQQALVAIHDPHDLDHRYFLSAQCAEVPTPLNFK